MTRKLFTYPDYGTPDGHPEHTAHSGQVVTVVRQLTNKECDPECQPMYRIKADDGWEGDANGSELTDTKTLPHPTGRTHVIEVREDDLLEIVFPTGHKISVTYTDLHPYESWPQFYIDLPDKLTINAWPDNQGKEESTVCEAVNLTIPVKHSERGEDGLLELP